MAQRKRGNPGRRGTTVVGLLVATSILTLLLGFAGMLWRTAGSTNLAVSDTTRSELQLRRALDRVSWELSTVSRDSLLPVPDAEFGTSEIAFQQVVDVQDGNPVRGPVMRLRHDAAAGQLQFTRNLGEADERTIVLCSAVSTLAQGETENGEDDNGNGLRDEGGFNVSLDGNLLTIRLTIEPARGADDATRRSIQTSLRLRN